MRSAQYWYRRYGFSVRLVFIEQNNPKKMYDIAGLNAAQISKKILDVLFTKDSIKVVKN